MDWGELRRMVPPLGLGVELLQISHCLALTTLKQCFLVGLMNLESVIAADPQ